MNKSLDNETLRKVQLLELKCLNEVKRICEENNINYFLIGGTLIGAVRHKGFIPWDDDIDIGMLRSDYDNFIEICKTKLNSENFFLQTSQTEEACCDYEIARIRLNNTHFVQSHRKNLKLNDGIFIEIIPYDSLPDSELKCKFYYYYFKFMKKSLGVRKGYKYVFSDNLLIKFAFYFLTTILRIVPIKVFEKQIENYHTKYNNPNSKYVFLLAGAYNYKKERHLRETVSHYSKLEFEGQFYPVPENYDLFLTEQYGDYMTPPPLDQQINKCLVENLDFGPYKNEVEN